MTYYVLPLTTLDDVIRQSRLKDESAVDVTATAFSAIDNMDSNNLIFLKDLLLAVSDEMQKALFRSLTPYNETKNFYNDYLRSGNFFYDPYLAQRIFTLDDVGGDDCLAISTMSMAGTALYQSVPDYRLRFPNTSPNYEVVFNPDTSLPALDEFDDTVAITGTWGYHEDYANMWADSGDTVQDSPLSDSATSLTVTSKDNFETYQILKIESEYLLITSITNNVLTVERGKNGSTAAAHANATAISKFVPMPAVAKECRRLVVRAYYLRNPLNSVVVSNAQIKELVQGEMIAPIPKRMRIRAV